MKPMLALIGLVFIGLASYAAWAQVEVRRGDDVYVGGGAVEVKGVVAGDVMAGGGSVTVEVTGAQHVAAAGGRVGIAGSVSDDVWAAGGNVEFDAEADRGLKAAGASLVIGGRIAEDAWLAGGDVMVRGAVGRDLWMAGGNVMLTGGGTVGGKLTAAAALVTVAGTVSGDAKLAGEAVVVSGTVNGNVEVEAKELRLRPGSHIAGTVTYRGATEVIVDEGAIVDGDIVFEKIEGEEDDDVRVYPMRSWPAEAFEAPGPSAFVVFSLAGFASGIGFFLLFPGLIERAAQTFRRRIGGSLLGGILTVILLPFAALLLMVTIIGLPLGVMAVFAYPLLLFAGYFAAGFGLAELFLNRSGKPLPRGRRILHYAAGILALLVVGFVPLIGPLFVLLALVTGVGSLLIALFGRSAGAAA